MHLVLRDHLACEDMAHEEIVVHRVSDNPGDGGRIELDEAVVLWFAGLWDALSDIIVRKRVQSPDTPFCFEKPLCE